MVMNWEKTIISPEATIRHALSVIDAEALRIALVSSDRRTLQGTVTDGDIRRGLLRGLNMDDSVTTIMNARPTVISPGLSTKELSRIMESKGILCLPVVEEGMLVGLETLQAALAKKVYENPVFLMAGGFGTRLQPLTNHCPKPLLKVGNKPILEITLLNFINQGFRKFYISTHYMPHLIQEYFGDGDRWGVDITYVHELTPLGTGGALGLLPEDVPDLPLIMMNGDILTNIDFTRLLEFHLVQRADATMCVREFEYQVPYGVIEGEGCDIISMVEKPVQRFNVNAGIYVVNADITNAVEPNAVIDMPTLLEQQIRHNRRVTMFPIHEYWLDIGRMEDFDKAQKDITTLGFSCES